MKVLNAEFDIDFMDADTAEVYEAALKEYRREASALSGSKHGSYAEVIRDICGLVFDFMDTLLGEGAAEEIFGEKCSLRTAREAMNAVTDEFERQTREMTELFHSDAKPVPQNRTQRRHAGKHGRRAKIAGGSNESAD